jgi:hypothetical protein
MLMWCVCCIYIYIYIYIYIVGFFGVGVGVLFFFKHAIRVIVVAGLLVLVCEGSFCVYGIVPCAFLLGLVLL